MFRSFTSRERRNYLLLMLAAALYFCGLSFTLLLPRYLKDLGASEQALGWLIGMPLLPFLLFSPLVGLLADRLAPRWLAGAGIVTVAASTLGMLWVDRIGPAVYLLRALSGLGHALTFTALFAAVAMTLSGANKARGIGYFTVVVQGGNIVGSFLGGVVLESLGAMPYFLASAGITATAVLACLLINVGTADVAHTDAAPVPGNTPGLERGVAASLILVLVLGGAFGMMLQFLPTYLERLHELGRSAEPIPTYYGLTALLASVAGIRLVFGGWAFRDGNEPLLLGCMVAVPTAVAAMGHVGSAWAVAMVCIAFGAGYGLLFPAVNGMALSRAAADRQGRVSGMLTALFEVGFRGFGFVMGPVAEHAGYAGMYTVLALTIATGFAAFFVIEQDRRRWLPAISGRRVLPAAR
ncbi:MFS transporter [Ectothiorhodospiraceae bacterium WFHF3C12]|nr:MFS transporter [Ectothiorhodospiraceae bacterium WFHF3C12]